MLNSEIKSRINEFSKLGQLDREYILSTVQPFLLNTSNLDAFNRNGYALKVLRDFIIIFYVPVNNNDESIASIKINNSLLHFFDISLEELYDHAIRNIGACAVLYPLDDVIAHVLNCCKVAESNTKSAAYIPQKSMFYQILITQTGRLSS